MSLSKVLEDLSKPILGIDYSPYIAELVKSDESLFYYLKPREDLVPTFAYVNYDRFGIDNWFEYGGYSNANVPIYTQMSSQPNSLSTIIAPSNLEGYISGSTISEPAGRFNLHSLGHSPTTLGELKDRIYTTGALSIGIGVPLLLYSAYNLYKLRKYSHMPVSERKALKKKSTLSFVGGSLMVTNGAVSMREASKQWLTLSTKSSGSTVYSYLSTLNVGAHIEVATKSIMFGWVGLAVGVASLLVAAYYKYKNRSRRRRIPPHKLPSRPPSLTPPSSPGGSSSSSSSSSGGSSSSSSGGAPPSPPPMTPPGSSPSGGSSS